MLSYKGYAVGPIRFDPDEKTFSSTVAGIRDVIHFEGTTADEFVRAFQASVDEYLRFCAERGQVPERSFSPTPPRQDSGDVATLKAAADRIATALADVDEEEFAAEFEKLRSRR